MDLIWGSEEALREVVSEIEYQNLVLLERFWSHSAHTDRWKRLPLLRQYTRITVKGYRPQKRGSGVKRLRRLGVVRDGRKCWVCRRDRATHLHHLIPIAQGGIDDLLNVVPVCGFCHVEIHKGEA